MPTFTIAPNDVIQGSIWVQHVHGLVKTLVNVEFNFTDTGSKRLKEFYQSNGDGRKVVYHIGSFTCGFKIYHVRKDFFHDGFVGLSEREAQALVDGLKGKADTSLELAAWDSLQLGGQDLRLALNQSLWFETTGAALQAPDM